MNHGVIRGIYWMGLCPRRTSLPKRLNVERHTCHSKDIHPMVTVINMAIKLIVSTPSFPFLSSQDLNFNHNWYTSPSLTFLWPADRPDLTQRSFFARAILFERIAFMRTFQLYKFAKLTTCQWISHSSTAFPTRKQQRTLSSSSIYRYHNTNPDTNKSLRLPTINHDACSV